MPGGSYSVNPSGVDVPIGSKARKVLVSNRGDSIVFLDLATPARQNLSANMMASIAAEEFTLEPGETIFLDSIVATNVSAKTASGYTSVIKVGFW